MLAHFHGAANSLIQELGAEQALCCALACMTGHTEEMRARSLLSNSDNFVTVINSPRHIMLQHLSVSLLILLNAIYTDAFQKSSGHVSHITCVVYSSKRAQSVFNSGTALL